MTTGVAIPPSMLTAPNFLGLNHPHSGFNLACPWSVGASWYPALPIGLPFGGHSWPSFATTMATFPEYKRLVNSVEQEVGALKNWSHNARDDYYAFIGRDMLNLPYRPVNVMEYNAMANPIRIDPRDGRRLLCICFDLTGFRPEEVNVTFNKAERAIIVEAGHEFKGAPGKGQHQHQVMRHFYRKYVFPEQKGVDYSKIDLKVDMRPDSIVCVNAILPPMSESEMKTMAQQVVSSTANYIPVPIKTTVA